MTAGELFQAGKLDEAITAALEAVRKSPTDTDRRGQLCELLCFAGHFERADKQMDTAGQQDPQAQVGVSMFRQILRGEIARQQLLSEGRVPEFLSDPSEVLKLHLQASIAVREGNLSEAANLLAQAEQQRVKVAGKCDGQAFDDFRDLDDTTASFFEVFTTTGKYYWIPIERVRFVEFRKPERPKDLLWRRANMVVSNGPEGEVYIPALYAGSHTSEDNQLRLGRGTEWLEETDSPVRGIGQRMFLIGDEARPIMQIGTLEFGEHAES
jgi:type VI secretion system protein ImpE